jgi:hypothetical protein
VSAEHHEGVQVANDVGRVVIMEIRPGDRSDEIGGNVEGPRKKLGRQRVLDSQ